MTRFAAYTFANRAGIEFDPIEYSRFKFGDKEIARKFGRKLAKNFFLSKIWREIIDLLKADHNRRVIILSSPYTYIPTATFAMKDYFLEKVNLALVNLGLHPAFETKIIRKKFYKDEYGAMSKEERFKLVSADEFHVDKVIVDNNVCLYMDDIVITGAHEHGIKNMIERLGIKSFNYFLYFAELTSEIDPSIENYLNYAFVKGLRNIDSIIKNSSFLLNTRVVKYILNSDPKECAEFLAYQKKTFLAGLYASAIGNSYHLIPEYAVNLEQLREIVQGPTANTGLLS